MTLNKQALKEVALFWALIISLFSYIFGICYLTVYVSPYFFSLIVLPAFFGLSYLLYTGSDALTEKPKKLKRKVRK